MTQLKTQQQVTEELHSIFLQAMCAMWSEQQHIMRDWRAELSVGCDNERLVFSVIWHDGVDLRKKTTHLHLHEIDRNPTMNFVTVFRTLIRSAGL